MSAILINRANAVRGALAGALGAVLLLAAVPAQAQEEDTAPDVQFLRRVLGAVGLRDNTPNIDYRERSPLVIPPSSTLPPPMAAGVNNPNWPVDPEVREARARSAETSRVGATGDMIYDDGRVLTPAELAKGRARRGVTPGTPDQIGSQASPQELGAPSVWNFFGKAFGPVKEESAPFTGEPARASLLEPPTGYQTPAPGAAYGIGKKNERPKASNYGNHGVLPEEKK